MDYTEKYVQWRFPMLIETERRVAAAPAGGRRPVSLFFGALLLAAPVIAGAVSGAPLTPSAVEKSLSSVTGASPLETAFREGVAAYDAGDYRTAVQTWQVPAQRGHAGAQFTLGVAYATGKGVVTDLARAIPLWEAAAAQGHPGAQFNLGVLYSRGEGVEKDLAKARMWWQFAATAGDAAAQFHLGALAAIGEGGPRNLQEAARWWRLSAAQGFEQAAKGLEILRSHGALPADAR
jgi:TPR repeat protein